MYNIYIDSFRFPLGLSEITTKIGVNTSVVQLSDGSNYEIRKPVLPTEFTMTPELPINGRDVTHGIAGISGVTASEFIDGFQGLIDSGKECKLRIIRVNKAGSAFVTDEDVNIISMSIQESTNFGNYLRVSLVCRVYTPLATIQLS